MQKGAFYSCINITNKEEAQAAYNASDQRRYYLASNRIYNKILDHDWFSEPLFVT